MTETPIRKPPPSIDDERERDDIAALGELIQIDLGLARSLGREIEAGPKRAIEEIAEDYVRIARSLRQTLVLKAQLQKNRKAALAARPVEKPRDRPATPRALMPPMPPGPRTIH